MIWLRKSKKGFTLIELMVVVAIIGVLALLGLRMYTGQQEKAKNAIVIANAGTIHTLIQGDFLDHEYLTAASIKPDLLINIGATADPATALANMDNPYGEAYVARTIAAYTFDEAVADTTTLDSGVVLIRFAGSNLIEVRGVGESKGVAALTGTTMTAQK